MKSYFLFLAALAFSVLSYAVDLPDNVIRAKNSICADMLLSHVDFLSSDYCRGRETGDIGMEVAQKYITATLKGMGAERAGEYGSFYQPVDLETVELSDDIHLSVIEKKQQMMCRKNAELGRDFLPIRLSAQAGISAPVVFAGYGITAPEKKYDDYAGIDVKGKIVLIMRHEPGEKDPQSVFDGLKLSEHASLLAKIKNAQKHGAAGILFVTDPNNHTDMSADGAGGTFWPAVAQKRYEKDEDYRFYRFNPRLRIKGDNFGVFIPAVSISGDYAQYILGREKQLKDIQSGIDENFKPASFEIKGKICELSVYFKNSEIDADNILAKVTGSDPELREKVVIVGAHYDHVGKDNRGRVFAGADDNASGTAGVLELARAFTKMQSRPKRSILFVLFTAEEKGLLGSRFYVQNPVVALEKTVAMINLDMIGRNDVDQLSLIGRYQYPKLYQVVEKMNKAGVNMEINFSIEQYIRQSDHFPFMRENIPSLFFNSGSHDQLHRPEDTVDRIIKEKMQKITQLVFLTLWDIADAPADTDFWNNKEDK